MKRMTNRELIDHCNSFWGKKGHCEDCPYNHSYCDMFVLKCRDTPFMNDTRNDGEFYTDEEIEYEN